MESSQTNGSSNGTNGESKHVIPFDADTSALSNAALQSKAKHLRDEGARLSQILTQRLASSDSGQNLLHIGTSLSTLPPDLHSLLQNLHPILQATESSEKQQVANLDNIVTIRREIHHQQKRCQQALSAAEIYQDLHLAEDTVRRENSQIDDSDDDDELDHAAALERAAHVTLTLVEELQAANDAFTSSIGTKSSQDTDFAEFLLKLAHRIRRLETDATLRLSRRMETVLQRLQEETLQQESSLIVLGHCMRGLALLGREKDVESIFARTAIMPLVRSKISMGRLDDGGSRGECAGLPNLLEEMVAEIANVYSPVLKLAESMFSVRDETSGNVVMDVDLLTAGVWVPIATALMADAGIKMAVFSPGIASILQTNYVTLDNFLAVLANRLLSNSSSSVAQQQEEAVYNEPVVLSSERIQQAQDRIYAHVKTAEFAKKWNLPIYYQLRFGECCARLNKAVDQTKREGWIAEVFTGSQEQGEMLRRDAGFELSLFIELYDTLLGLWLPDVILRPLTNRFLRGAVQLVGRVVSFIDEGMEGKLLFGEEPPKEENSTDHVIENGTEKALESVTSAPPPSVLTRKPYCWGESEDNVAAVAWELTVLESSLRHDYANTVCKALSDDTADSSELERDEIRSLVAEVLAEVSDQIHPVIDKAWNKLIVELLTQKCSTPVAAVKGVAATYRMTNRPPPKQASPFVSTILRPIKEFDREFANRTPDRIGAKWKQQVVVIIADRYAGAVADLIATVERTEEALKNRRTRRTSAGGMSDGEKVKLQLFLDYRTFSDDVREVGLEPSTIIGLSKLGELTADGEKLSQRGMNGA